MELFGSRCFIRERERTQESRRRCRCNCRREARLRPYYTRLGLTSTVLEVAADHSFVMKLGKLQLKGKVEKDEENNLIFSFSAFGKISLGKLKAHATKKWLHS